MYNVNICPLFTYIYTFSFDTYIYSRTLDVHAHTRMHSRTHTSFLSQNTPNPTYTHTHTQYKQISIFPLKRCPPISPSQPPPPSIPLKLKTNQPTITLPRSSANRRSATSTTLSATRSPRQRASASPRCRRSTPPAVCPWTAVAASEVHRSRPRQSSRPWQPGRRLRVCTPSVTGSRTWSPTDTRTAPTSQRCSIP